MDLPRDPVKARLRALENDLRNELGGDATVQHVVTHEGRITTVSLTPSRSGARAVVWIEMVGELTVQAGHGGRWELGLAHGDVDFLEELVRSVIAGRVIETFAWKRSRVEITLSDGQVSRTSVGDGLLSLIPLPGWSRLGRRTRYRPYR